MTSDEIAAAVERSLVFRFPCLVWVKLDPKLDPIVVRDAAALLAKVTERTAGRVHFITTTGETTELSGVTEVSDHDLVSALLAERGRPSVQQQAEKLRERFVIIPRDSWVELR